MCACEWNYVCTAHRGTPQDYRYFLQIDPREVEDDERARVLGEERADVGITRAAR